MDSEHDTIFAEYPSRTVRFDDTVITYFEDFVNDHISKKMDAGKYETARLLTYSISIIRTLVQHCADYGIGLPNRSIAGSIHIEDYKHYNEDIIDVKEKSGTP